MIRRLAITAVVLLWNVASMANPEGIPDDPNQLIVQVKGIVCSFCAFGAEKNLSKLDFLDKTQYGDGVLIDIDTHRITLALDPEAAVQYGKIAEAITRGGYDPVTYYPVIRGTLHKNEGRLEITSSGTGQTYVLPEGTETGHAIGQTVQCRAELSPEAAAKHGPGDPILLTNAVIEAP